MNLFTLNVAPLITGWTMRIKHPFYHVVDEDFFLDIFIAKDGKRQQGVGHFRTSEEAQLKCDELNKNLKADLASET